MHWIIWVWIVNWMTTRFLVLTIDLRKIKHKESIRNFMRLQHYLGQNQGLNFSKETNNDTNVTLMNLGNVN